MRKSEITPSVPTLTNLLGAPQFIALQLSFSTADIEKGLFFGAEHAPEQVGQPLGRATILVVHGEMFALEEATPQPATPLSEESGLFRIAGLGVAEQPQP